MTIYTFKLSRKKIIGAIVAVALLLAAIILLMPGRQVANAPATAGRPAETKIKSSGDCVTYAQALGYEVRPEPGDTRKVTIPKAFDDVYLRYNKIQLETGFDLEPYCGKGVTLYTFYVTNYQGYDDVLLDILVYKNKIIGGAVYTAAIDGFMHGLTANPTL